MWRSRGREDRLIAAMRSTRLYSGSRRAGSSSHHTARCAVPEARGLGFGALGQLAAPSELRFEQRRM